MDFSSSKKYVILNLVLLSLFLLAFIPLCTWTPLISRPILFAFQQRHYSTSKATDELEIALSRAATIDKTVIITILNKAYVEPHNDVYPTMMDLFLEGFWVGEGTRALMDHLVVVSMDQTAYDRCLFRRLNCYRLVTKGVDFTEEKLYMSDDFIKMMWARTLFLLDVLKRGYNFVFTDTDVLWLRDPFLSLKMFNETDDWQISTDHYKGRPRSTENAINTGFYYIRSNNKTQSLFQNWYDKRLNSTGMKEQDVLQTMITDGIINKLRMRVRFLNTLYFSGFCEDSQDARLVATVHANCCRSIGAKVNDLLVVLKDWKRFKQLRGGGAANNITGGTANSFNGSAASNINGSAAFEWSVHDACLRSWEDLPAPAP